MMKKSILMFLVSFLILSTLVSQSYSKIKYKTKVDSSVLTQYNKGATENKISYERFEQFKLFHEEDFVLFFEKQSSYFYMPKVNDKKFYLNLLRLHQLLETLIDLKNKECIEKKFSMFSYRDTIDRNKWTIIPNVKKMIGRYNCSLATIKFIAAEYKVWFAEDIPVPFGPGSFHGLPGLVLEAVLPGKYTIYASEINLNDPKIKSFPKYDFGKIIKYEESEKFIKEHMPKRKQ